MNASTALSSSPPRTHTQLDGGEGALPVSSLAFLMLCFVERDPSENAASDQHLCGDRKK